MKIKLILVISLLLILTGCFFDAYKNEKYGELAIKSWFEDETLGKRRKEIEQIDEIKDISCKYRQKYNEYYVFKCNINYTLAGTTKIPLSSYKDMEVYALFKPSGKKFKYRVYNSSYKDEVWLNDEDL